MSNRRVFSVSQITSYIHRIFEGDYALKRICIRGEVSNCKYHSSGHLYFTLKDEKSQIRCLMFASDVVRGLSFPLKNGQLLLCEGSISVYEASGIYQLYVRHIELSGSGQLYLKFEQLKRELYKRGYFDLERKKPLPAYPSSVGIVTASGGAAIRDIVSVAKRRNPYVQLYLYPARVQGEGAAASIAAGIRFLDQYGVDLIIIGRGGGSIEDLWAFNELEVANAIYEARTPLISGTGHEVDTTIADLCADVRAATPTAACQLALPDLESIYGRMDNYLFLLNDRMEGILSSKRMRLKLLAARLADKRPEHRMTVWRMQLAGLARDLNRAMDQKLIRRQGEYERLRSLITSLAPSNRLGGGYSYARTKEGEAIGSVMMLEKGQIFDLIFKDGEAEVSVNDIVLQK